MKRANRPIRLSTIALVLLTIVSLAGLSGNATVAQDGDPPAGWECSIESADLVSLLQLVGQIGEVSSDDVLQPIDPAAIVPGESVDADDLAGLEQTSRELAACVNGRDVLRLVSLFTPSYQARVLVDLLEGDEAESILEDIPIIAGQIDRDQELFAIPIEAAWYSAFSDHEIVAILAPYVEGLEEQRRFIVHFVFQDGRWLIDDMRLIGSSGRASRYTNPVTGGDRRIAIRPGHPVLGFDCARGCPIGIDYAVRSASLRGHRRNHDLRS